MNPLTIWVDRIEIQQDELKPLPPDNLTLELLSPKRDVVTIRVQEGTRQTLVRGVIEYRGDALTLSRKEGDGDMKRIAEALGEYYVERYSTPGLRIIRIRENGRICDCTLPNPPHFSKFLHLIHNTGEFDHPAREPRPYPYARAQRDDGETYEVRVQLADRVYKPLLKEIVSWNDPIRAMFSVWTTLEQDERMWTKKVPKQIVDLLSEAREIFANNHKLRTQLGNLILGVTIATVISHGIVKEDELGTVDFRLVREPGGYDNIYILWIWEQEKDLSNYVMDIVELYPQYKMKWWVETWLVPRPGGAVRRVAEDKETREIIDTILKFLMPDAVARKLQENNRRIKELGRTIYSLIDKELESA